jgi:DNA ligase 1
MPQKPMLAATIDDVTTLRFPILCSQKLDGVRATVQDGRLLSRSLKPIPNTNVQELFAALPGGLDGELVYGDPTAANAYRQTVSRVMSDDKSADGVDYHVFDKISDLGFRDRLINASVAIEGNPRCHLVQHVLIHTVEELEELEAAWLAAGHEGLMVRSLDGIYKHGRSSVREGILLKLKRFVDANFEIVGTYEELENTNNAFTNELGRTARSTAQAGKLRKGTLGGFELRGLEGNFKGVQFRCGSGFDAAERESLWAGRDALVGQICKAKYFPSGAKSKPRHPIFLGLRSALDV